MEISTLETKLVLKLDFKISLWKAVKLRIAGIKWNKIEQQIRDSVLNTVKDVK